MNDLVFLCRLDDIGESGSIGVGLGSGALRREIFIVRRGDDILLVDDLRKN